MSALAHCHLLLGCQPGAPGKGVHSQVPAFYLALGPWKKTDWSIVDHEGHDSNIISPTSFPFVICSDLLIFLWLQEGVLFVCLFPKVGKIFPFV